MGEAPVTVEEVVKTLHTNAAYSRAVAAGILQAVHDHVEAGKLTGTKGSMEWSCVTKREVRVSHFWQGNEEDSGQRQLAPPTA